MNESQQNNITEKNISNISNNNEESGGITRYESLSILGASILAAGSALLATIIAKRVLTPSENTEFLTFWALVFGIIGIVAGIQQESTRAVGAYKLKVKNIKNTDGIKNGANIILVSGIIGAIIAILIIATSPLWGFKNLPTETEKVIILISITTFLYALHFSLSGSSAGLERWYIFSGLGGGEAIWRIIAMFVISFTTGNLWGFEVAVISPAILWVLLALFTQGGREAFKAKADVSALPLARRIFLAMGSSLASAVLMMGFPVIIKSVEGQNLSTNHTALLGMLFLAISICRSPIMIPLQAFQGFAVSSFLKQRHRPIAVMLKPSVILLAIGFFGAIVAWFIGPWLFRLLYPPKPEEIYVYNQYLTGELLASLVFASAVLALLVLSGTAVIAIDSHRFYVLGWVTAAIVAILLLLLPLNIVSRVLVALYVGPMCGFTIHLIGMKFKVE